MDKLRLILVIGVIIAAIAWGINVNAYYMENKPINDPSPNYEASEPSYNRRFTNSQLEEDVIKYMDYIKPYYYYNDSNMLRGLTLEQLKEQGGVCRHYALWYIDLAEKDGYYAYKERTDWRDGSAHAKTKITSIEGDIKIECYVDQLNYWCNEVYG